MFSVERIPLFFSGLGSLSLATLQASDPLSRTAPDLGQI